MKEWPETRRSHELPPEGTSYLDEIALERERCGCHIPTGTCLTAGHIADTIAYPGLVIAPRWTTGLSCGKSVGGRMLVDLVGIEPTTSSMPWKRAPSCATGPRLGGEAKPVNPVRSNDFRLHVLWSQTQSIGTASQFRITMRARRANLRAAVPDSSSSLRKEHLLGTTILQSTR